MDEDISNWDYLGSLTTRTDIFKTKISSYRDVMGKFKVGSTFLPQNTPPKFPRPQLVVMDDIIPDHDDVADTYKYTDQQKGPSMSIFKFTTVKPSALKIWTTLIDTPIHPREGYTEDQIRYRMFICLQLSSDFKLMVSRCNGIIDSDKHSLRDLFESSCTFVSCQESDFSDLSVLSQSFPHWGSSELYTPYYLTKMLCHRLNDFTLLLSLFDRTALLSKESDHWNIDQMSVDYPGLTAYKLFNSISMDEMLPYITISYDRTPRLVMSMTEMHLSIRDQLMQSIKVSDNFIIPDGAKTTIPYFILRTPDASQ